MEKSFDVLVIGAGQAGLAISACLSALGIDHQVVERGRVGERWRSERWDSLRMLTPNWMTRLPGVTYKGPDPDGFMRKDRVVRMLTSYRYHVGAPVLEHTEVTAVDAASGGYRVATSSGVFRARAVVIAIGACSMPNVPAFASGLSPDIEQVVPSRYRRADLLPVGGVLVVGASATGVQLASEIHRSGRPVTLAVGKHVGLPRRYRGRDIMEWLDGCGFLSDPRDPEADSRKINSQPSLQLVGGRRPETLDLPALQANGVRMVGRVLSASGREVALSSDLPKQVAEAERRRNKMLDRIDDHILANAIAAPDTGADRRRTPGFPDSPERLDLKQAGISTVVWATGFRRAYPWLNLPVTDAKGELIHRGGVTAAPGLFALGLPFMRHRASSFIDGVGRDAEALAPAIAAYLEKTAAKAA